MRGPNKTVQPTNVMTVSRMERPSGSVPYGPPTHEILRFSRRLMVRSAEHDANLVGATVVHQVNTSGTSQQFPVYLGQRDTASYAGRILHPDPIGGGVIPEFD